MYSPLRIGFLISDTGELPAWESEMLEQLFVLKLIKDITFIYVPAKPISKEPVAYQLFKKFESKWFGSIPDAFKKINVTEQYPDAACIPSLDNEIPVQVDIFYRSCLADNRFIPDHIPRCGIWSISFGSNRYKEAEPPAFWETMNDEAVIGSSLLVRFPGNTHIINIYDSITTTVPYSVKNTLSCLAWKSSSFFAYRLKELLLLGDEVFFAKYLRLQKAESPITVVSNKIPGNLRMLLLFVRNIFRYLRYKLEKKNSHLFTLLYSHKTYSGGNPDLISFRPVTMPAGVFWADPFVITQRDEYYVFFEEFLFAEDKAHISVITIDKEGNCSVPVMVLDKSYHLSYPFVFEWQNDHYMIPDTNGNKTVELYKASQFPYQWELVMNLMENIVLIDTTLLYENNTWWLFGNTTNSSFTSTNDQLLLYYSRDLFSQNWTAHPQNPIVTDIGNCRPAGKIFRINDQLFRPAQNNASRQYGYALCINKVMILNETTYAEEKVSEIVPSKNNKLSAVHTFNFSPGLTVIDGIVV